VRVNITYSVGLDDIPTEIDKLLIDGNASLKEATTLVESLKHTPPLEMIEAINSIRETMGVFDMRLVECLAILSGYIDIRAKVANPSLSDDTGYAMDDDGLGGIDE